MRLKVAPGPRNLAGHRDGGDARGCASLASAWEPAAKEWVGGVDLELKRALQAVAHALAPDGLAGLSGLDQAVPGSAAGPARPTRGADERGRGAARRERGGEGRDGGAFFKKRSQITPSAVTAVMRHEKLVCSCV